jgi:hypothetical protein
MYITISLTHVVFNSMIVTYQSAQYFWSSYLSLCSELFNRDYINFMLFTLCIFLNSIFKKTIKCTNENTIKQITKHTSYQVTATTCFGTKVPPSGSFSTAKVRRCNNYSSRYSPTLKIP